VLTTKVIDTYTCTSSVQHAYFLGNYTYSVAKMSHYIFNLRICIKSAIDKHAKIEYNYTITRIT